MPCFYWSKISNERIIPSADPQQPERPGQVNVLTSLVQKQNLIRICFPMDEYCIPITNAEKYFYLSLALFWTQTWLINVKYCFVFVSFEISTLENEILSLLSSGAQGPETRTQGM